MLTEQELALVAVRERFGLNSYTEDHIHFRLVGFYRSSNRPFAIGDTWAQAIERLERKAKA